MDWARGIVAAIEQVSLVLAWATVPFLGAATWFRFRSPTPSGVGGRRSGSARASFGLVAVVVVLAAIEAHRAAIPVGGGWVYALVVGLLALLFWDDRAFWRVFTLLFALFSVIGAVILYGLSHNYADVETEGLWYGGRQLVEYGGLGANPTRAGWEGVVAALAVLGYGLPLAIVTTGGWMARTDPRLGASERLALCLTGLTSAGVVLTGASFMFVAFGVGSILGLPPGVAAAGMVGALVTVVLAGSGGWDTVIVGGRELGGLVPRAARAVRDASDSSSSVRELLVPDEAPSGGVDRPLASLAGWVGERVRGVNRRTRWMVGLVVGLIALSFVGIGSSRSEDPRPIAFEPVDRALELDFVVARTLALPDGKALLIGDDGSTAVFDGTLGVIEPLGETVSDPGAITVDDAGTMWIVRGDVDSAVVAMLDPQSGLGREIVLDDGFVGRLVAHEGEFFVLGADGRVGRWSAAGERVAAAAGEPGVDLQVAGGRVWTLHERDLLMEGSAVVGRNRADLVAVAGGDSLLDIVLGIRLREGEPGFALDFHSLKVVDPADLEPTAVVAESDEDAWLLDGAGDVDAWVARPLGGLTPVIAARVENDHELHFHYDSVNAVVDGGEGGLWIVATDDRGTVVDTREVRGSYLAHWEDGTARLEAALLDG